MNLVRKCTGISRCRTVKETCKNDGVWTCIGSSWCDRCKRGSDATARNYGRCRRPYGRCIHRLVVFQLYITEHIGRWCQSKIAAVSTRGFIPGRRIWFIQLAGSLRKLHWLQRRVNHVGNPPGCNIRDCVCISYYESHTICDIRPGQRALVLWWCHEQENLKRPSCSHGSDRYIWHRVWNSRRLDVKWFMIIIVIV